MIINPTEVVRDSDSNVVAIVFESAEGTLSIRNRPRPNFWQASIYEKNDYLARPRVYVSGDTEESVLDHLNNRTNRPTKIWRKGALNLLNKWALPFATFELKWSQNAGCRMCPCSPGFVMQIEGYSKHSERSITLSFELPSGQSVSFDRYDVWVELNDTTNVDASRPSRDVTPVL
jgi:hypothetical protein